MTLRSRALKFVLFLVAATSVVSALFALPARATALDPAAPTIVSPAASALVAPTFLLTGRVGPGVADVQVTGAVSAVVTLLPADSEGATFTATVTVGYGRTVLSVEASDGVAWSAPATLTVWQLGATPAASNFVLVDKSDFMLYVVRSGCVIAAYPVAIGTYATPTQTGTRYLGRPVHAPNSVWGPFRMRLYKMASVRVSYKVRVGKRLVKRWRKVLKLVGTSYYIHGTNAPSSIGTPASHGCVRMWNSNLRVFSTLTTNHELTVIRS
jgi:lipoprotein-anchoring transpeptidase ErfK/SrfK